MTPFNFDPYKSENLEELRRVVACLQQMLLCLEKANTALTQMTQIVREVNREQDEKNTLLKQRIELSEQLIQKYESILAANGPTALGRLN